MRRAGTRGERGGVLPWLAIAAGLVLGVGLALLARPGRSELGVSGVRGSPGRTNEPHAAHELPLVRTPAELRALVRVCRAAGASDVPWLRRAALESPDPLVAGNAVRALGRLGSLVGDAELLALLDDARPRVRQELVLALSRSGEARAREILAAIASGDDGALAALAKHAAAACRR